jgi:hypothetical protein
MRQLKKMSRWLAILAMALTLGLSAQAKAAYQTAVAGYTPAGSAAVSYSQSLGFDFKANSNIIVNELGIYQVAPGSLTSGQTVYLYDITTSALVSSASLTGATQNGFNYVGITATTLNTSDTYSIYSVFAPGTPQYASANPGSLTFSTDITIQLIQGANTGYTVSPTGNPPTPPSLGYSNILAVDFQYSPASTAVPEPSSIALMGLGVVGLVFVRRKMTRRSA